VPSPHSHDGEKPKPIKIKPAAKLAISLASRATADRFSGDSGCARSWTFQDVIKNVLSQQRLVIKVGVHEHIPEDRHGFSDRGGDQRAIGLYSQPGSGGHLAGRRRRVIRPVIWEHAEEH
jgi:hypothetical protein